MIFVDETDIMPVCDTCKSQIEFLPLREVLIEDCNFKKKMLYFHYFFPCWDFQYFINSYPEQKIISSGFLWGSEILEKPYMIKNIENNLDLWI